MNLKEKPVQTCDIDRHKIQPIGIKIPAQLQPIGIKKFPERAILMKKCAKNQKYSRSGHFVKKSICQQNGK